MCCLNGGENYCCRVASFASVQSYLYHADTTKGIVDLEINRGGEELKVCRGIVECAAVRQKSGDQVEFVIIDE
jgi:hypothetical protein